jgi:hypothetical protein
MISVGPYKVCVLDFFTDEKSGRLSATKLWLHVANIIMSKVMLEQQSVSWELLAAYGAVVGGSHIATLFMKWKYGNAIPDRGADIRQG